MDIVIIIIGFILVLIGLVGVFIPVLPGPPLSWLGVWMLFWTDAISLDFIGYFLLFYTLVLALISLILEYLIPAIGAKYLKGTKYGIWGNYIGLIIGLFTPVPFGFLIFSFLGALAGELLYDHKDFKRALSAAIGTLIGFLVSVFLNTGIALVMLIVFLYFVISNWSAIF